MDHASIPNIGSRQFVGWFFQPDELLGWKMIPGRQAWYTKPGIHSLVRANHFGLRGEDFPVQKPAGVTRVLVLADSFGAAIEVEETCCFARVMERGLNSHKSNPTTYQVINAGIGGYGTEQELLFLQTYGEVLRPDIVLVAFHFGDDLIENSAELREKVSWRLVKLPRPYFLSDSQGKLTLVNYPPKPASVRQAWMRYYDLLPWECWKQVQKSSGPYRVARLMRSLRRAADVAQNSVKNTRRRQVLPVDLIIYNQNPVAAVERTWQHTEYLFSAMHKLAGELGADLYVAGLCTKEQAVPGYLESRLENYPESIPDFVPNIPNQRLASSMDRLGIPYIDLTPVFTSTQEGGKSLFFQHDLHWNEKGHALAGETLAKFLSA